MNMKRIPGLVSVIELDEATEIAKANELDVVDRQFTARAPLLNGRVLSNLLSTLSYHGRRFPTMMPRHDSARAYEQNALWKKLNARAAELREGSVELEPLSTWLKGAGEGQAAGILVQELIGRAFSPAYVATQESWNAAVTLDASLRIKNPLKLLWWRITGRIRCARKILALKVAGNRAAIHGTGVAIHNMVVALNNMRKLYIDLDARRSLSAADAVQMSLSAPAAVLRQATTSGSITGCPFQKGTLFLFKLSDAFRKSGNVDVVFQRGTWNQCPAEQWVPALLEGVWTRATRHHHAG